MVKKVYHILDILEKNVFWIAKFYSNTLLNDNIRCIDILEAIVIDTNTMNIEYNILTRSLA